MNSITHKLKVLMYSLLATFLSITLVISLEAQRNEFLIETLPFV